MSVGTTGLTKRERGSEHAREVQLLGLRVRQHDDVGTAEVGRKLGIGYEPGDEPHPRRGKGSDRLEGSAVARRSTARRGARPARPRAAPRASCTAAADRTTAPPAVLTSRSSFGSGCLAGWRVRCSNGPSREQPSAKTAPRGYCLPRSSRSASAGGRGRTRGLSSASAGKQKPGRRRAISSRLERWEHSPRRPRSLPLICSVVRVKASFQRLVCSVGARPYLGRRSPLAWWSRRDG
jgi:hypothetical protein